MAFSNKEKIENFSKIKEIETQKGVERLFNFATLNYSLSRRIRFIALFATTK